MISFRQFRRFLLTMSLAAMLAITIAFGFGSTDSWAATSLTEMIGQPQAQIATMNRIEAITKNIQGKAQEAIDSITGDPQTQTAAQATGQAKQFKTKTLDGINNSIENPNYQPSERTKQAKNEDQEGTENLEAQVLDNFNKTAK